MSRSQAFEKPFQSLSKKGVMSRDRSGAMAKGCKNSSLTTIRITWVRRWKNTATSSVRSRRGPFANDSPRSRLGRIDSSLMPLP